MRPQDNFYTYANEKWLEENPLPDDYSTMGVMTKIHDSTERQLKTLIDGLADDPQHSVKGTPAQKVNDLYELSMDVKRRDAEGPEPVCRIIEKIRRLLREDFTALMAWLHEGILIPFFSIGVGPDKMDSTRNILHAGGGCNTLGDRDYYLVSNPVNDRIFNAFEVYVKKVMGIVGYSEAEAERVWQAVRKTETEMARHMKPKEAFRDPMETYHIMSWNDFRKRYSTFDWDRYMELTNIQVPEEINVAVPDHLDFIFSYIETLSTQEKEDFIIFHLLDDAAGILGQDLSEASFELFGKTINGVKKRKPLWKRAQAFTISTFGDIVGQLYVEKYFPAEYKSRMLELVDNLREALRVHIEELGWMGDATKARAIGKLDAFGVKIGYPDKWEDYTGCAVDPADNLYNNVVDISRFFYRKNIKKLEKPVDKAEWHMYPQTVNAYYSPLNNEICFPAGILQAPLFDPAASDCANYGAIGAIIGHEMTHGFDDYGRKFDKDGNLHEWWTDEDAKAFDKLTERIREQYDSVEVAEDLHANGTYTLGENIADQGGVRLALTALKMALEKKGETLTKEHLREFFTAYARSWATHIRPESIVSRTQNDPHSLPWLRVNEALKNIDEFYEAFDIKEGDGMWMDKERRTVIW